MTKTQSLGLRCSGNTDQAEQPGTEQANSCWDWYGLHIKLNILAYYRSIDW